MLVIYRYRYIDIDRKIDRQIDRQIDIDIYKLEIDRDI